MRYSPLCTLRPLVLRWRTLRQMPPSTVLQPHSAYVSSYSWERSTVYGSRRRRRPTRLDESLERTDEPARRPDVYLPPPSDSSTASSVPPHPMNDDDAASSSPWRRRPMLLDESLERSGEPARRPDVYNASNVSLPRSSSAALSFAKPRTIGQPRCFAARSRRTKASTVSLRSSGRPREQASRRAGAVGENPTTGDRRNTSSVTPRRRRARAQTVKGIGRSPGPGAIRARSRAINTQEQRAQRRAKHHHLHSTNETSQTRRQLKRSRRITYTVEFGDDEAA